MTRTLLIGCGDWGSKLLARLQNSLPQSSIYVAEESWPLVEVPRSVGIVSKDYKSMLQFVEACVIATPINTHEEIVSKCLEKGKHVLCEKPLSKSGKSARELVTIAKTRSLVLHTDLTFLHDERVDEYRNRTPGEFLWWGKPSKHPEDGVLWSWGPHPVSLMLHYCGKPDTVEGYISQDNCQLVYGYGHSTIGVVLDWRNKPKTRTVSFKGLPDLHLETLPPSMSSIDPLQRVIDSFLLQCTPGQTISPDMSAEVVEVLEWTEQQLSESHL